ncbi:hypothetical protein [Rhodococcus sp. 14C212]|uniref:hypothetical protein n=1 Tax=Rhodococcus sp. 14C212 TaxID=2711209 RepID=UPI0019826346
MSALPHRGMSGRPASPPVSVSAAIGRGTRWRSTFITAASMVAPSMLLSSSAARIKRRLIPMRYRRGRDGEQHYLDSLDLGFFGGFGEVVVAGEEEERVGCPFRA